MRCDSSMSSEHSRQVGVEEVVVVELTVAVPVIEVVVEVVVVEVVAVTVVVVVADVVDVMVVTVAVVVVDVVAVVAVAVVCVTVVDVAVTFGHRPHRARQVTFGLNPRIYFKSGSSQASWPNSKQPSGSFTQPGMHIYIKSTTSHVPQSTGQREDKSLTPPAPPVIAILVQRDRVSPGALHGSAGSRCPLQVSVVVVPVVVVVDETVVVLDVHELQSTGQPRRRPSAATS